MADFRFKQFSINQDKCAMKVGTDGVLLGAWCSHPNPFQILDIGTGTGLIALMCAQRFPNANITAIEPEKMACTQAIENTKNSVFSSRIELINSDLLNLTSSNKFDLIVCNPPFFTEQTLAPIPGRKMARSANFLPLEDILVFAKNHLTKNGVLCLVLPFQRLPEIESNSFLHLKRLTKVSGTPDSDVKRILVELSISKPNMVTNDAFYIEKERHIYSEAYMELTKDFYLNM